MPRPTRLHGVRAARTVFGAKQLRVASAAFERRLESEVQVLARVAELPYDASLKQRLYQIAELLDRPPEHTPSGMAADLRALRLKFLNAQQDHAAAMEALNFATQLLEASPDLGRTHITLLTVEGVLLDLVEPIENLRALRQKLSRAQEDHAAALAALKRIKELLEDSPNRGLPRGIVRPLEELKRSISAARAALDHEIELLAKEGGQGKRADQRQRRAAMLLLNLFAMHNRSPRRAWPRARKFIVGGLDLLGVPHPDFEKHPQRLVRLLRPSGYL